MPEQQIFTLLKADKRRTRPASKARREQIAPTLRSKKDENTPTCMGAASKPVPAGTEATLPSPLFQPLVPAQVCFASLVGPNGRAEILPLRAAVRAGKVM